MCVPKPRSLRRPCQQARPDQSRPTVHVVLILLTTLLAQAADLAHVVARVDGVAIPRIIVPQTLATLVPVHHAILTSQRQSPQTVRADLTQATMLPAWVVHSDHVVAIMVGVVIPRITAPQINAIPVPAPRQIQAASSPYQQTVPADLTQAIMLSARAVGSDHVAVIMAGVAIPRITALQTNVSPVPAPRQTQAASNPYQQTVPADRIRALTLPA